jgi:WD40 repeat protein
METGTRIVWDVENEVIAKRDTLSQAFRASDLCCWTRGNTSYVAIATGVVPGATNCITLWDARDWTIPVCRIPREESGKEISFQSVAVSLNGLRLAGGDGEGNVYVWDISTLSQVDPVTTFRHEHAEPVNSVVFLDPEGTWLASASGKDGESTEHTIRLWNCVPGEKGIVSFQRIDQHTDAVLDLALSADRSLLASASNDNMACLWDVKWSRGAPQLVLLKSLVGHSDGVQAVAFHPNGRRLATGSKDRLIKLWDTSRGVEVATLRGHTGAALRLQFDPSGQRLISGSGGGQGTDNVVWIWDTQRDRGQ